MEATRHLPERVHLLEYGELNLPILGILPLPQLGLVADPATQGRRQLACHGEDGGMRVRLDRDCQRHYPQDRPSARVGQHRNSVQTVAQHADAAIDRKA
jgi:hypothetical protein